MAHYEQKLVNGNFYWYRRECIAGRQTSTYLGKNLPATAEQCIVDRAKFEAARNIEVDRHALELEIIKLQKKLSSM